MFHFHKCFMKFASRIQKILFINQPALYSSSLISIIKINLTLISLIYSTSLPKGRLDQKTRRGPNKTRRGRAEEKRGRRQESRSEEGKRGERKEGERGKTESREGGSRQRGCRGHVS